MTGGFAIPAVRVLEEAWMKRQVLIFALRTTVLDPINLGLILVLFGTWMLRAFIEA